MTLPIVWGITFGDGEVIYITEDEKSKAKILAQKQRLKQGKGYKVHRQWRVDWK